MAAQPSTTSAAAVRSRSLRLHAKVNLTAPQTTAPAAAPPANSTQIPSSTSNVLLFLTNLRLLDLDQEPDWPDITPATFSTKDAAGGQKKRIQCVEWALYQLFLLWDHAETQNKLRPFYPPVDQVQSINLRAALLRCLEQAKKNGVLGRDVVIRKTMLDECRGERFEEVLAVFSSVVLKKLVAERALNSGSEYRPTISENLALQNWGYSGDRTELNGLLLAHKASLASLLAKKNASRARYHDFEELLSSKERELTQRKEQAKASTQGDSVEVSDRAKAEVRRIMRTNWAGNEQWVDCLLFNETRSRKDNLLGARFEDVWAGVQNGKIAEFEDRNVGLLEQLDNRVRLQKKRLEKWDGFRKEMFGGNPPQSKSQGANPTAEKKAAKGVDFGFTSHLKFNVDDIQTRDVPSLTNPPKEYLGLLQGMKTELDGISKPKIPDFSSLVGGSRRIPRIGNVQSFAEPEPEPEHIADGVISDMSEWEEEPEEVELPPPKPPIRTGAQTLMIPGPAHGRRRIPKSKHIDGPVKASSIDSVIDHDISLKVPKQNHGRQPASLDHQGEEDTLDTLRPPAGGPSIRGPSLDPPTATKEADPTPSPPRQASPTQAAADEILASITNASPSPIKKPRHTLSLTERTRMSMSHSNTFDIENESPPPSPLKASPTKTINEPPTPAHDTHLDPGEEYEDLVARTRRSMAGFEAARQKAQLERRRSQRREKMTPRKDNKFPRLDEEEAEGVGDTSVVEELLEDDTVDYAAVFKSRPRLAMSPVPMTPGRRWDDDD
ncbi:HAUS augmin-like complex subunit 6 N-terminus-domain-containing protein [Camillea tinctor]|nr:HAUS augmin-like complex subunit 6 N-terminus-domain-containing protein [Camillea tinctor]